MYIIVFIFDNRKNFTKTSNMDLYDTQFHIMVILSKGSCFQEFSRLLMVVEKVCFYSNCLEFAS